MTVPRVFAQRLPLKSYPVADGLPNNVINKIVRDSRGFLGFCTSEGLDLAHRMRRFANDSLTL